MNSCILWTGPVGAGKPIVYVNRIGRNPQRGILEDKLGRPLGRYEWITTTCQTRLCIQPDHITLKGTPEHFWSLIDTTDPDACWVWTGASNRDGYGEFVTGSKNVGAHRFAWQTKVGPIPDGLVIDHLCSNRICQNPAHMEPVTQEENARRGLLGKKKS